MNEVERVLEICKKNSIPVSAVEKKCGFSNGYIARLRKGFFPPDRRQKIIDFFGKNIFDDLQVTESQEFSDADLVMIEYLRADDMTKEMVKRILAYSRGGDKDA